MWIKISRILPANTTQNLWEKYLNKFCKIKWKTGEGHLKMSATKKKTISVTTLHSQK